MYDAGAAIDLQCNATDVPSVFVNVHHCYAAKLLNVRWWNLNYVKSTRNKMLLEGYIMPVGLARCLSIFKKW